MSLALDNPVLMKCTGANLEITLFESVETSAGDGWQTPA